MPVAHALLGPAAGRPGSRPTPHQASRAQGTYYKTAIAIPNPEIKKDSLQFMLRIYLCCRELNIHWSLQGNTSVHFLRVNSDKVENCGSYTSLNTPQKIIFC